MNRTSATRPLAALAASFLLLCTAVMVSSAGEAAPQSAAAAVGTAVGCGSPQPDNPAKGVNLGPLLYRAV
ncbi:MAG: hypothetical protein WA962_08230 [Ornithinimicrobium sp.]